LRLGGLIIPSRELELAGDLTVWPKLESAIFPHKSFHQWQIADTDNVTWRTMFQLTSILLLAPLSRTLTARERHRRHCRSNFAHLTLMAASYSNGG
jgi:hypothetical protein